MQRETEKFKQEVLNLLRILGYVDYDLTWTWCEELISSVISAKVNSVGRVGERTSSSHLLKMLHQLIHKEWSTIETFHWRFNKAVTSFLLVLPLGTQG